MLRRAVVMSLAAIACLCTVPALARGAEVYDPTVRPDPEGVVTPVSLGIFVLDVVAVDDRAQQFTADVFASIHWQDARLASPDPAAAERILPKGEIWNPAVVVLNRRGGNLLLPETVRVDARGNVTYEQRFFGTFASPLDLHRFPRDEQDLVIELASHRYTGEEIGFSADSSRIGRRESLSLAGWDAGAVEFSATTFEVPGGDRAGGTLRLRVDRQTRYYLLTLVLPLVLIALMAWTVFWIDPTLLPSQIAVSTASVFSLIAFRFSLIQQLPRVSYLTQADWFVLLATLLVFGALGETIVAGRYAKSERIELARRIDAVCRWVYLAVLALVLLWALR